MKKLGLTIVFFCEKYWASTWNKQKIIGLLQILLKFVLNDYPYENL